VKCSSGKDKDNIIAVALRKILRMHTPLDEASEVEIKRLDSSIFNYFTKNDEDDEEDWV